METILLADAFWRENFVLSVYKMFASVAESCKDYEAKGGVDDGVTAIEVEARLGDTTLREQTRRFSPGISQKFFDGIRNHYCKHDPHPTETYDVTFRRSRVRVSVQVKDGEPTVVEVIKKSRETLPTADAFLKGEKVSHDFRVSLMVERQVPKEECETECEIAKRWVSEKIRPAFGGSGSRLEEIATGCACKISPLVGNEVRIHQGTQEFKAERGWLQPQLQWTILQPRNLKDLNGQLILTNPQLTLADYSEVIVGNLPGRLKLRTGESVPVSAFEFQLILQVKDLNPASASPVSSAMATVADEVFVRYKRRWKHKLRPEVFPAVIDFTETRQGETPLELQAAAPKFEVELERCYSLTEGKSADPVHETVEFLRAAAGILFSTSVKRPLESEKDAWRARVAASIISLDSFDKKRSIAAATSSDRNRSSVSLSGLPEPKRQLTAASEEAEGFYNQLNRTKEDRVKSLIFHMRCLNNFSKSTLLSKYLARIPGGNANCRILELSCGKGADLGKMKKSTRSIERYVGTDIAKNSLEQAVERLGRDANLSSIKFISADLSKCDISQPDWGAEEPLEVWERGVWNTTMDVLKENEKFNFVSMQFALHYMFSSIEALDRFFSGVSARMESGAFFVTTTVNANALISALLNSPDQLEVSFKDEKDRLTCLISFEQSAYERLMRSRGKDNGGDWVGLQYRFKLFDGDSTEDRAVDAPEWMVTNPTIQKLADKHGLRIIEQASLGDFVKSELERSEDAVKLWRRMSVPNRQGTISDIEWSIANLYQVIAFQKLSTVRPSSDPTTYMSIFMRLRTEVDGWNDLTDTEKNALIAAEQERLKQT